MKRILIGAAVAAVFSTGALAADLPERMYTKAPAISPIVYEWTGFYIGGNVGWGWLDDRGDPFCTDPTGALNGPGCDILPGGHVRGNGVIGGGQVGYNWQVNNIVYGLEADIQGADINGTFNFHGPITFVGGGANVATFVAHERLDWLGTVRPRVGFLVTPQALLYATGGLAYGGGSVDQNVSYVSPAVQFPSSTSFTKLGWTAGGGLEWKLAPSNWSAKLEALYYDLGSVSTAGGSVPVGFDAYMGGKVFNVRGVIARAGIDYHFGGPAPAKY